MIVHDRRGTFVTAARYVALAALNRGAAMRRPIDDARYGNSEDSPRLRSGIKHLAQKFDGVARPHDTLHQHRGI